MSDIYRGTTALVTGASKGLGREFAAELARRGARVVLVARSEPELKQLSEELRQRHGDRAAEVVVGDLSAPNGPDEVVAELRERGLAVDLLVNNAGMSAVGPFLTGPFAPAQRSVDLNVSGLLALTHAIGRDLVARGSGGVINVSSGAAFQAMPYQTVYAATKAFVTSFTEGLAEELRGTGVHVMASHPGAVATAFFDGTSAEIDPAADTPRTVVVETLDDYARRRVVSYPGRRLNRILTWPARFLPRHVSARLAGNHNRGKGMHEARELGDR